MTDLFDSSNLSARKTHKKAIQIEKKSKSSDFFFTSILLSKPCANWKQTGDSVFNQSLICILIDKLMKTNFFLHGKLFQLEGKKYATDIHKKNSSGFVVPMVFSPVNKKLFCSNVPIVQSALCSLEKPLEQSDWLIFLA